MASNNSYNNGPLYSHGWDEREEQYRPGDMETNWGPSQNNFTRDSNPDPGGFTGAPGSNYAAGSFKGAAQGMGYYEDQYRGYAGGGNNSSAFASHYTHDYGWDDYHRPEQRRDLHRERYLPSDSYPAAERREERHPWEERAAGRPAAERSTERAEGPHRGKGPKNYRRADNRIREDVSDRLSDDPYLDATNVHVHVEDGNVVLSGHVENREAKRRAVDLAESVRGVTNVENRLRTGQGIIENLSHAITAAIGDVTLGPDVSTVETPKRGRKKKS